MLKWLAGGWFQLCAAAGCVPERERMGFIQIVFSLFTIFFCMFDGFWGRLRCCIAAVNKCRPLLSLQVF